MYVSETIFTLTAFNVVVERDYKIVNMNMSLKIIKQFQRSSTYQSLFSYIANNLADCMTVHMEKGLINEYI